MFDHITLDENPLECDCHDCYIYQAAVDSCTQVSFHHLTKCRMNGNYILIKDMNQSIIDDMHCMISNEDCPTGFNCKKYSCKSIISVHDDTLSTSSLGGLFKVSSLIQSLPDFVPYLNEDWYYDIQVTNGNISVLKCAEYLNRTKVLNITYSHIQDIEHCVLDALEPIIEVLDLSHNDLQFLPYSYFTHNPVKRWPNLKHLYLHGNKWMCDCNLIWLKYIIVKRIEDEQQKSIVCSNPSWLIYLMVHLCAGMLFLVCP